MACVSVYYLPVLSLFSKSLSYLHFPTFLNCKYSNKVPQYLSNEVQCICIKQIKALQQHFIVQSARILELSVWLMGSFHTDSAKHFCLRFRFQEHKNVQSCKHNFTCPYVTSTTDLQISFLSTCSAVILYQCNSRNFSINWICGQILLCKFILVICSYRQKS